MGAINTRDLLIAALSKARSIGNVIKPQIFSDSGGENVNDEVQGLEGIGLFDLVIAQIDVEFSNSLVEALFRSLKHNYLFLQRLESLATLERCVNYYFGEHNEMMPHHAFAGATPYEIHTGQWNLGSEEILRQQFAMARTTRFQINASARCPVCPF